MHGSHAYPSCCSHQRGGALEQEKKRAGRTGPYWPPHVFTTHPYKQPNSHPPSPSVFTNYIYMPKSAFWLQEALGSESKINENLIVWASYTTKRVTMKFRLKNRFSWLEELFCLAKYWNACSVCANHWFRINFLRFVSLQTEGSVIPLHFHCHLCRIKQ